MTLADFLIWQADPKAIRIVLVEAAVQVGGVEQTRYMSNRGYTTSPTDTLSNVYYEPLISAGIQFTEALSIDGAANLSVGDIEIDNANNARESWVTDVWTNRKIQIWVGDPRWPRADFQMVFNGIGAGIARKDITTLALRMRDKTQRLNTAMTEHKLGGITPNKDSIIPLCFGEVHNITPLLIDPANLIYQVHDGAVKDIFEVRDNGVPVVATISNATGTFTLNASPAGAITCSVQGDAPGGIYSNTVSELIQRFVTGFGKPSERFTGTLTLVPGLHDYTTNQLTSFSRTSTANYLDVNRVIQTAAADVPRIDYSTGGSKLLIEDTATNLLKYSEQANNVAFVPTGSTITPNATLAPDGTMTADKLVETTTTAGHSILQTITPLGNTWYAWSRFYKAAERTFAFASVGSFANQSATASVYLNLLTGAVRGTGSNRATVVAYPNGWWKLTITVQTIAAPGNIAPGSYTALTDADASYPGDGTSGIYVWGGQFEVLPASGTSSSYIRTASAAVVRAADAAFVSTDLDTAQLATFDSANQQPVGVFISDRTNIIDACQMLASSIGAQISMSRLGLLRLFQINFPATGTSTDILPHHVILDSLVPSLCIDPVAAIKLGFCKNWTKQPGLQTGIPAQHKDLFNVEWLTTTQTDTGVQAKFKLDADPVQRDTMLLRLVDADTEALRELDIWKTMHFPYEFEGTPEMFQLQLGQPVMIYNRRYSMSAGVPAIVMSLTPNYENCHIQVGILV